MGSAEVVRHRSRHHPEKKKLQNETQKKTTMTKSGMQSGFRPVNPSPSFQAAPSPSFKAAVAAPSTRPPIYFHRSKKQSNTHLEVHVQEHKTEKKPCEVPWR